LNLFIIHIRLLMAVSSSAHRSRGLARWWLGGWGLAQGVGVDVGDGFGAFHFDFFL
jgi:hypothetical protein